MQVEYLGPRSDDKLKVIEYAWPQTRRSGEEAPGSQKEQGSDQHWISRKHCHCLGKVGRTHAGNWGETGRSRLRPGRGGHRSFQNDAKIFGDT